MKHSKNHILIGAALGIIALFFIALSFVPPTQADGKEPQVLRTEEEINANQVRIAELRPFVEEFERIKADNAKLTGRLEVFGYQFDWSTGEAVKLGKQ